jgi:trans-2,3-dihydro-3-hydroxyanthranilate isomerase
LLSKVRGRYDPIMAAFRYTICDVFTNRPLTGNQLAVFAGAEGIPEDLLQPLAREMNFSETVFVYPASSGGTAQMRIFTPRVELPFAGHPVLGTAFVLANELGKEEIVLETGKGLVPVLLYETSTGERRGRMSQPIPTVEAFPPQTELLAALGVARSELPVEVYVNGPRHVYVVLSDQQDVARLSPDLWAIARLPISCANCSAPAGSRWKTRVFAPGDGVPEDPATGSGAGPLACHLARHGRIAFGQEIEISQGAELGRPSTLYARAEGTKERLERVEVSGSAVIVGRGEFHLPPLDLNREW